MTTEDNILIENYLKGLLSDKEKQLFEERLQTDEKFYNEYILEKQLRSTLNEKDWGFADREDEDDVALYNEALKHERYKRLEQTLSDINTNTSTKSKQKKNISRWYYLAAASILIFVAIQFFFNRSLSNEELYYEYAGLNNLPSFVTRDYSNDVQVELTKGEQEFKDGNFSEAIAILEPIRSEFKDNSLVYIYIGLAQIELELYEQSENTFNDLIENRGKNNYTAHWYKALLYLKQEDTTKALEQLDRITKDSSNLYYQDAQELIDKIKR